MTVFEARESGTILGDAFTYKCELHLTIAYRIYSININAKEKDEIIFFGCLIASGHAGKLWKN